MRTPIGDGKREFRGLNEDRRVRPREAFFDVGEFGEAFVRKLLVPVCGARIVVAPVVGMAVLDAHAQGFIKDHGIIDVIPIHSDPLVDLRGIRAFLVVRYSIIDEGVLWLHAPGMAEVIL